MRVGDKAIKIYEEFSEFYDTALVNNASVLLGNNYIERPCMQNFIRKISKRNQTLLDIGCGGGFHLQEYSKFNIKTFGIDTSDSLIKKAQKRSKKTTFLKAHFNHIPFPNANFDIVTASLVVDYIDNPLETFKEIRRVLKKNGLFIFSDRMSKFTGKTSIKKVEFLKNMQHYYYERSFRTYLRALTQTGFTLVDSIPCKPIASLKKKNLKSYQQYHKNPKFLIYVAKRNERKK